jgi:predicted NBD/HSP70 family sugar kinase
VTPAKPSLELLRSLTDEHVLRALMETGRLTRADLATHTGLSKPTIGESVRRLTGAGLVVDTGERTPGGRGRGRVGSYYAVPDEVGAALVVSIAPDGVVAECLDVHGGTVARTRHEIGRPATPARVAAALQAAAAHVRQAAGRTLRLAVVSAADPVDRATGRLVQLPDAPFLLGELNPVEVLAPHVAGPVTVDNDVNWAAQAERDHTAAANDFAYVHLGEGLGCAVVSDGEVRRGHAGIAGEIAHLLTAGPHGRATRFIEVFGELGLRRDDSTAIDVDRLLKAARGRAAATREALGRAVGGVLTAVVALTDPEFIVVGGSWGSHPAVLDAIASDFARHPRHVPVQAAELTEEPSLTGARDNALGLLRAAVIGRRWHPTQ